MKKTYIDPKLKITIFPFCDVVCSSDDNIGGGEVDENSIISGDLDK